MRTIVSLLLLISIYNYGYGDKAYKVINFKIPQRIWQKALSPTPVLKSPVTITLPVNVQDYNDEDVEEEEDEVIESSSETIINNDEVTGVQQEPVLVTNNPVVPAISTESPALQDEVIGAAPPVPGQIMRFPCDCRSGQCGCCTGALMERINMKACSNITFIPEDFVFDVKLNVNNRTVVRRRVSASDPPPICFNPRRAPFIRICAELSNIQIRNRNAHACLNINADIGGFSVYSASFRCFRFGASGLQTGQKPRPIQSSGPKPTNLFGNTNNNDEESGFLENAASNIFGEEGLFQGGGSSSNDDGPLDGIGDAFGDFLDFE